ncbi:hypothetical protein PM082_019855 [Marasmius tenuissimus]|nr:hypothetical protein PM082_019855 [Marasmius tenuissimus]
MASTNGQKGLETLSRLELDNERAAEVHDGDDESEDKNDFSISSSSWILRRGLIWLLPPFHWHFIPSPSYVSHPLHTLHTRHTFSS